MDNLNEIETLRRVVREAEKYQNGLFDEKKVEVARHLFAALNSVLLAMNYIESEEGRTEAESSAVEIRLAIKALGGVRHLCNLGA